MDIRDRFADKNHSPIDGMDNEEDDLATEGFAEPRTRSLTTTIPRGER
jgi:hypothetical protein